MGVRCVGKLVVGEEWAPDCTSHGEALIGMLAPGREGQLISYVVHL